MCWLSQDGCGHIAHVAIPPMNTWSHMHPLCRSCLIDSTRAWMNSCPNGVFLFSVFFLTSSQFTSWTKHMRMRVFVFVFCAFVMLKKEEGGRGRMGNREWKRRIFRCRLPLSPNLSDKIKEKGTCVHYANLSTMGWFMVGSGQYYSE